MRVASRNKIKRCTSNGVNAKFSPAVSEKVFKLGMNDLAEALLLPTLHLQMKDSAPNSSITNYYVTRDIATEELKSGTIDVLLDAPAVNAKSLQHMPLATLPWFFTDQIVMFFNYSKIDP